VSRRVTVFRFRNLIRALTLLATCGLLGAAAATALPAGCVQAGQTVTCTYTSGSNPLMVPVGVTSLHVVAVGGKGGDTLLSTGLCGGGAPGAVVSGDIPVAPGSTLYADVAGNGGGCQTSGSGGVGGGGEGGGAGALPGGGGGGASDVRTAQDDLSTRLIVAAGGGGGGSLGASCDISTGSCNRVIFGGAGGSGGAAGGNPGSPGSGAGGGGGGSTRGGTGGAACIAGPPANCAGATAGTDGSTGIGGTGGNGGSMHTATFISDGGGGGGGGAGWFGAGGGGGGDLTTGGGGGGGGSNLVPPGGAASIDATGTPMIQLSYRLPPTSKEQCKGSGWRNYPQFKNQGQCISFVDHNK